MASDQLLINVPQVKAVPLDNPIPASLEYTITAATSTFDGTSAASSYLPALQIIGPGGVIAATFVDWSNTVAAGDSVEVTFGTFLKKPASPCPPCDPLTVILTLLGPNAVWKLDEVGGTQADDSSGNHHDLTATGAAPTWAAGIAPTGTNWPQFSTSNSFGDTGATKTYSPNLSGDFTICAWFQTTNPSGGSTNTIASQGNPGTNHSGWRLGVDAANVGLGQRLSMLLGTGSSVAAIQGDVTMTGGVPFFCCVSHTSGVFSLYVNGVKQTTTYSGAYASTSTNFVIGPPSSGTTFEGYVMLFVPSITDGAIALLYQAA